MALAIVLHHINSYLHFEGVQQALKSGRARLPPRKNRKLDSISISAIFYTLDPATDSELPYKLLIVAQMK